MSDERFEYAKKLTEFIAEAQEYVDCEGLELIDRYNKSLPVCQFANLVRCMSQMLTE